MQRSGSGSGQDLAVLATEIIDANRYLTLATADGDGRPWAAPVWYASG
jgi:nitroimidazol reductase NimA-like FMN-containing flavoprotein (pyridoxamine 5'-phosphate oxidase superfamily)